MTQLVVGPLLRHVGPDTAAIWLETDQPCDVRVLDTTASTFTVHGHHYALVQIEGLAPGSDTEYEVALDGETVWPEPGSPPSRIRIPAPGAAQRIAFGSCRVAPGVEEVHGPDVLGAFARRLADGHEWPDLLLMVGDQVYADETGPEMRKFIEARRDTGEAPGMEIADYEEYTELYRLAWTDDAMVRWLLSTVPSLMVFDDHDIRDDWNTSETWLRGIRAQSWWHDRITGGLGAYWVYQHLGNMSAAKRAEDPVYREVLAADGDAGRIVDEFAERADRQADGTRWSYSHDYGRTRLVVVDSRCGRVLRDGRRSMLDDEELEWVQEQCRGDVDHLIVATSLPFLLPATIHHLESFDEAIAGGAWGRRFARLGEKIRQGADLEHWAAFEASFHALADTLLEVARREDGPQSITLLSGDVHYSYLARVAGTTTPISQVVCSPMRNHLPLKYRLLQRAAYGRLTDGPARALARLARVPRTPMTWRLSHGPWFDNAVATLVVDGSTASVRWEAAGPDRKLREVDHASLSKPAVPRGTAQRN
ncbi:alkaline phosphatase D family protein [Actinoallomurus iriomotensis]|uniref:Metallophosphatase n=1 Tax=Actinoallomurus iriomotensis TaxID=478107 RepID=A0A9W6S9D7_9ACTN|nr:alkaline phosphatase D family protein [Actinoallomurus iriomotensis]GLY90866.1 metallophosphatase [Actinoallomurus iriomotensis]